MNQTPNEKELWMTALGEIELAVSRTNFSTWFKNTELKKHDDGSITIYAPNIFNREWLENKYNTIILTALQRADVSITNIRYEVAVGGNYSVGNGNSTILLSKKPQAQENQPQQPTAQQGPASTEEYDATSNLNARYSFDSFVIGSHNELAFAACQAVAKKPGNTYNPLFLYGGVGLGKTHLLQATGNALMKNFGKNVLYSTSEKFTSELITSIGRRTTSNFKSKDRY